MFPGGCKSWNLPPWQCAQPITTATLLRSQYWDFAAVQRSPGTIANDFCSLSQPVPALDDTDPKPFRFSHCSLGEPPPELVSLRWRWSNKWRLVTVSLAFSLLYAKADGLQGRHMEMAGWGRAEISRADDWINNHFCTRAVLQRNRIRSLPSW